MDINNLRTRESVVEQIKGFWGETVQGNGTEPDVHINLLTPDGKEDQPLAYDIVQQLDDELYTVTWVEKRLEAEKQMGLSGMTWRIAVETMRNLVIEAQQQSSENLIETRLVTIIPANGIGLTYGRHRFLDGHTTTFATNYQSYFTGDKLLRHQNETSGILFKQVTATLDQNGLFGLNFG